MYSYLSSYPPVPTQQDNSHTAWVTQHTPSGIEEQREHFDNLRLRIGYIYGDMSIPSNTYIYKPAFVPGARPPHAWIKVFSSSSLVCVLAIDSSYVTEFTPAEVRDRRFSTLDHGAFDAVTLIVEKVAAERRQAVVDKAASRASKALKINAAVLGEDFELLESRRAKEWAEKLHLQEGAAACETRSAYFGKLDGCRCCRRVF